MSHVIIFVCLTLNMGGENLWKCYTPSVSFWSSYFRLAARPRSGNSIAPFFISASNELSTPAAVASLARAWPHDAVASVAAASPSPATPPTRPALLRRWYRRYLHLRVRHHLHGASGSAMTASATRAGRRARRKRWWRAWAARLTAWEGLHAGVTSGAALMETRWAGVRYEASHEISGAL